MPSEHGSFPKSQAFPNWIRKVFCRFSVFPDEAPSEGYFEAKEGHVEIRFLETGEEESFGNIP